MGGGGSSNEVKETEYQKELARIADAEWNRYGSVYRPLEDRYMSSVDKLGSEQSYKTAAGDVNTAYQSQFTEAGEQQERSLAAAGVDPSSGRAQAARQELGEQQAATASQSQSAAQHDVSKQYTGGLQNITAMGKGQQTQAINSLQDLGQAAQQKAISDAQLKAQESSLPASLIGAAAGGYSALGKEGKQSLSDAWSSVKGGANNLLGGTSLDATNTSSDQRYT